MLLTENSNVASSSSTPAQGLRIGRFARAIAKNIATFKAIERSKITWALIAAAYVVLYALVIFGVLPAKHIPHIPK